MNFNTDNQPEYKLNTSLIEEIINLYGVKIKFLITEKINSDDLVFGDYSHLKTDNNKIYDLFMLPENSDDWDQSDSSFNPFGLTNYENINLFVSRKNIIDRIPELADETGTITGNLIVLPNNKIMEITQTMWEVPGVNNLFTSNNAKSVLKLTCKPYDAKLINEVNPTDISVEEDVPYSTLDVYFQELIDKSDAQDDGIEVLPSVQTIQKTGDIDVIVQKPIVDKSEDDVWGSFN